MKTASAEGTRWSSWAWLRVSPVRQRPRGIAGHGLLVRHLAHAAPRVNSHELGELAKGFGMVGWASKTISGSILASNHAAVREHTGLSRVWNVWVRPSNASRASSTSSRRVGRAFSGMPSAVARSISYSFQAQFLSTARFSSGASTGSSTTSIGSPAAMTLKVHSVTFWLSCRGQSPMCLGCS